MSPVVSYINKEFIKQLDARDKFEAIEELTKVFSGNEICSDIDVLIQALKEREEIMSTGIGFGIAIPHAKITSVSEMAFAIGISKNGINFDSMDGEPVHLIILVAAGEKQHKEYLRLMSSIMAILKVDEVKEKIVNAESNESILEILNTYDRK